MQVKTGLATAEAPEEPPAAARGLASVTRRVPRVVWNGLGLGVLLLLFGAIAAELHHILADVTLAEVKDSLAAIPASTIALAYAATLCAYAALVGYEFVALRQVGVAPLSRRFVTETAFISYSFTFVLGFGVLTGGAVRLRRYRMVGLSSAQILAVTLLGSVNFWFGLALVAAVCLTVEPAVVSHFLGVPRPVGIATGLAILGALGGWILWRRNRASTVRVGSWTVRLPGAGASVVIAALGVADILFSALALWLILPADVGVGYAGFVVVFALATVAGVISHAPGGLGAFEAVILLGLPSTAHAEIAASLLAFRLVYYVTPFAFSLVLFAIGEARASGGRLAAVGSRAARTVAPFIPRMASLLVFAGGVILILSGTVPAEGTRLAVLSRLIPLPFVETSHFVASVVGAALLVVTAGLLRRRKASYQIAVALLGAGAVFSLVKGLDVEEALLCAGALGLLVASRRSFYRGGGAFDGALSWRWITAAAAIFALSIWVGLLTYRSVEYSNELWWHFAVQGDASRFLRGTLGVAVVLAAFALYRLVSPPSAAQPPRHDDLDAIATITARTADPEANLALLGDKTFLFSGVGDGFVMYGVEGTTYLAMGDPVTDDPRVAVDLIWRFRELADQGGGDPAFYHVKPALLPHYIDAGFSFAKLGEVASVDLRRFSLEGPAGSKFRQVKSRAERAGLSFRLIPASDVPAMLPQLHTVSDIWLAQQKGREKGFSLGFWSEPYLARFDHAVIEEGGTLIAFANIWRGAAKGEMSIDLMRHRPEMPNGTMDYLFISLMESAKADGFEAFSLGFAPMAGMPEHQLAPAWSRFARLLYDHGNQFYNFRGLRDFKAKFKPDWQPRYLAHTGQLAVPRILVDATRLISRGPAALKRIN